MSSTLIKDGYLLDPELPFERQDILIENGLISKISSGIDSHAETTINATNRVVLPGLINAHTHTFSLPLRGLTGNIPLDAFLLYIDYAMLGSHMSPRDLYVFNAIGAAELLRTGTTSLLEVGPPVVSQGFDRLADATAGAFADVGVRAVIAPMYDDLTYAATLPLHLLGDLTAKENAALDPKPPLKPDELIRQLRNFLEQKQDKYPNVSFCLGAHNPNKCSRELMEQTLELSSEFNLGIHIHLVEAKFQLLTSYHSFRQSPAEYLASINCLGPSVSFAHGVWLDNNDIQILKEAGSPVVHNPVANMRRGDGVAPIQQMRTSGLDLALGTDSSANNDSENMFEVMKYAALMHKLYGSPSKWLTAQDVFEMCLNGGAKVLQKKVGSLKAGYHADLVILNTDRLFITPKEYFINQLIYSDLGSSVETVLVGGNVVLEDKKLRNVDEVELYSEARDVVTKIYKELPRVNEQFALASDILEKLNHLVVNHELPFCRFVHPDE
jgi:5-methylthioadenosine/S-adenosylhomocysteine deaminase